MTTTDFQLDELIEQQIKKDRTVHERNFKLHQALKRLMENEDFKLIIQEEYLTNEPKTLAVLLASTTMEPQVNLHMRNIHGVGSFRKFLERIVQQGEQAKSFMNATDEELINYYSGQFSMGDE